MSKKLLLAIAVTGLVLSQVSSVQADPPNNAIRGADAKIRPYERAPSWNGYNGYYTPGAVYGVPVYAGPVYAAPVNSTPVSSAPMANNDRQVYRSFSFNPGAAPAPVTYYAPQPYYASQPFWSPFYGYNGTTPPKFYDANRKISGKDFGY